MRKLIRYLKPYWKLALLSPILMAGEVLIDLYMPKLMSSIVNQGILGKDIMLIVKIGIFMLVIAAVGGFFGVSCAYTASKASQSFGHDLRCDVFDKIMSLSLEQTDKFTTGSLVTRLTNDVTMVQDFVNMSMRMFVRAPIFFLGGIVMMLSLDISFGLVLVCALPVLAIAVALILKKVSPLYKITQERIDRVNSVVQENVGGARVIKAYVREDYENARFDKANSGLRNVNYKALSAMSLMMPTMMLVMNMSIMAVILIGGWRADTQGMLPGTVMAAINYLTQMLFSILMIAMMFHTISRAMVSAKRICEVLETTPTILGGDGSADGNDIVISFKNVSFRYPNTSGTLVLNNINLDIKRGETVAFIGSTGCGKTTLASIIPRFYDVTEGEVFIEGVPIRDYDIEKLRSSIGFVMQKSELFSGTVAENISWGKPEASIEEIEAAAKIAQADDFIRGFSNGYESYIAEKGASLSGGQKQRLSIARAVLRHPKILILDDATSALDLSTESRLQASLKKEMKDTTVVLIAQRIASVRNADRIAVVENGRISACAPHDELMKISETYRDIFSSQMKNGGTINE